MKNRNVHNRLLKKSVFFVLIFLLNCCAIAQSRTYSKEVTFGTSNDFFVWFSNTDRFYTYGIHTDFRFINGPQNVVSRILKSRASFTKIGLNVQAYTPDHHQTEAMYQNRPYAGWSYLEITVNSLFKQSSLAMGFDIGILGPHSFAGDIQNWFHREFTGDPELTGWENQLGDFFGINLKIDYFKPIWRVKWLDASLELRNSIGTIFMFSEPGLTFRLGKFNPSHRSSDTGNRLLSQNSDTELFLGLGDFTKLSGYNATLQGNIFKGDSLFRQDEINNLILNARATMILAFHSFTMAVRYHWSDGEFNNGDEHQYMTISTAYQFD